MAAQNGGQAVLGILMHTSACLGLARPSYELEERYDKRLALHPENEVSEKTNLYSSYVVTKI